MKQWNRTERAQVKYFVSDMWKPYADFANTYLKNAVPLVDKYHYIRQIIWAFERVRKIIQKKKGCNNKIKVLKRNAYGYRNLPVLETAFCISFTTNILPLKKWLPKTATLFRFNFFDPNY